MMSWASDVAGHDADVLGAKYGRSANRIHVRKFILTVHGLGYEFAG